MTVIKGYAHSIIISYNNPMFFYNSVHNIYKHKDNIQNMIRWLQNMNINTLQFTEINESILKHII